MKSIILAGGSGTRLWPLSRKLFPKQFLKLFDGESLLQKTVKLISTFSEQHDICIIGNEQICPLIKNDLAEIAASDTIKVVPEVVGRNTAPAIALALKYCIDCLDCDSDEVVFISPSDFLIKPADIFADHIKKAVKIAQAGHIVTLGVMPVRPETGYGYIKRGQGYPSEANVFFIDRFIEKPSLAIAEVFCANGNFFWNAGMFVFTIRTMLEEFKKHAPEISQNLTKDYHQFIDDFARMPNISIDFAVIEKSQICCVIPLTGINWTDVGCWDTLSEIYKGDQQGNFFNGDVLSIDTANSFVFSHDKLVTLIGIKDCIVINTKDAVLIAKKGESQKVKEVIKALKDGRQIEL